MTAQEVDAKVLALRQQLYLGGPPHQRRPTPHRAGWQPNLRRVYNLLYRRDGGRSVARASGPGRQERLTGWARCALALLALGPSPSQQADTRKKEKRSWRYRYRSNRQLQRQCNVVDVEVTTREIPAIATKFRQVGEQRLDDQTIQIGEC